MADLRVLHLETLGENFDAGDVLALFDCVIYCDKKRLALPDWAVAATVNASDFFALVCLTSSSPPSDCSAAS